MKSTSYVQLFGGPSAGKSTIAAGLFYKLKLQGWSVELVTEFAKELIYSKRSKCLADQCYVTAMQNHRMYALKGEVDFVITDSPMILGAFYTPKDYPESFPIFLLDLFNSYTNFNFFINRVISYVEEGRAQTELESNEKVREMLQFLSVNKIPYENIDGDINAVDKIIKIINMYVSTEYQHFGVSQCHSH